VAWLATGWLTRTKIALGAERCTRMKDEHRHRFEYEPRKKAKRQNNKGCKGKSLHKRRTQTERFPKVGRTRR